MVCSDLIRWCGGGRFRCDEIGEELLVRLAAQVVSRRSGVCVGWFRRRPVSILAHKSPSYLPGIPSVSLAREPHRSAPGARRVARTRLARSSTPPPVTMKYSPLCYRRYAPLWRVGGAHFAVRCPGSTAAPLRLRRLRRMWKRAVCACLVVTIVVVSAHMERNRQEDYVLSKFSREFERCDPFPIHFAETTQVKQNRVLGG